MTHKTDGKYIIVDSNYIDYVNFREVEQTDPTTLRYSTDKSKFILKYMNEQPDFVYMITGDYIGLEEYTHSEIKQILNGSEWVLPRYPKANPSCSLFEHVDKYRNSIKVQRDRSRYNS